MSSFQTFDTPFISVEWIQLQKHYGQLLPADQKLCWNAVDEKFTHTYIMHYQVKM